MRSQPTSCCPAFPQIAQSLGVESVTDVQSVITAYMMGFAFSQLFMGFISDRYGRRPVLIGGLVVYTIASIFTAIAGDFSHLLAARFAQGLGSGAPRVIATASVRDCYDGRKMARVMSLTMTIFMAAPVLAPAIGQAILLGSSWRWVMGFIAIYGIIVLVVCWRVFPETLAVEDRRVHQLRGHWRGIEIRARLAPDGGLHPCGGHVLRRAVRLHRAGAAGDGRCLRPWRLVPAGIRCDGAGAVGVILHQLDPSRALRHARAFAFCGRGLLRHDPHHVRAGE